MAAKKNLLDKFKPTPYPGTAINRQKVKRYRTPAGGIMMYPNDDETTPIARVCLACKGEHEKNVERTDGSYSKHTCRWCSGGLMDQHSVSNYLNYVSKTEEEVLAEVGERTVQDLIDLSRD